LGERIGDISFQHVLVSPLQRAKQTCRFAGLAEQAVEEPDLIEWDNGDYEGRTHIEIETTRPGWNLFRDGCPNGESPQQISDRADQLILKLRKLDGNVALFTHGHFGRVLAVRWISLSVEFAERFLMETASLSILSYQHSNLAQPAISLWNSRSFEANATPNRSSWDAATTADDASRRRAVERWENEGGELDSRHSRKGLKMNSDTLNAKGTHSTPLGLTMRAVEYNEYGDASVLHVADRPIPQLLPDQLFIEVLASSVNPIDYRFRRGDMKGLIPFGFPRIPGYDVAGIVVDTNTDCSFAKGDRVMAFLDHARGGALADYAACSVASAAKIPDAMSMEEAAAIPLAGTTALQSLRDHGKIKSGQSVLINGASGGVGMFAVQIAKSYGCHVDAIASGQNREFCLSLGADHFYDYEKEDFTKSDERWDIIFDVSGKAHYMGSRAVLKEGGHFISTEPSIMGLLMTILTWPLSKSGQIMLAVPSGDDLRELIRLYEAGKLKVTIDSTFPFEQAAQAHRRVETGVDHGKVVLVN
jgi:NADPH2:quinone reductase